MHNEFKRGISIFKHYLEYFYEVFLTSRTEIGGRHLNNM